MSFLVWSAFGFIGGLLGGMGMGGGTALIPLLTLFGGVNQTVAQGVNLLSFLPMSVAALAVHRKNGLVGREKLFRFAAPALLFSAGLSLVATRLPSAALRAGFGAFLFVLAVQRLYKALFALPPRPRREKF